MSIKIAIVDDHPLLIKGLQSMFIHNPEFEITGTYNNGKELLLGLREKEIPDVLLLDIQIPGLQGDELAPIIHKNYPDIIILALTHMEHEYYIKTMLQCGVKGYVLKSSSEQILIDAIKTVAKNQEYFDPAIRKAVFKAQQKITQSPTLTRREKEIMKLISLNCTSIEIAEKLSISKRTVDRHRENLLLKLDVRNVASLIKKAIDLGLIK